MSPVCLLSRHSVPQVSNCDELSKPRLVKPNLETAEPVCEEGLLQCGDGECLARELFCDTKPDCR